MNLFNVQMYPLLSTGVVVYLISGQRYLQDNELNKIKYTILFSKQLFQYSSGMKSSHFFYASPKIYNKAQQDHIHKAKNK